MFAMKHKIIIIIILLACFGYWFTIIRPEGAQIDKDIQREIESRIPACQERDKAAKAIKEKEIKPGVYSTSDLEDYDKKFRACFDEFVKEYSKR